MSGYMDQVDNEFVKTLYPEYLLKQPIAYTLLSNYYKNKKLFHKTNHNQLRNPNSNSSRPSSQSTSSKIISTSAEVERDSELNAFYTNQLSPNTKREVWQKLMKLGVLGTVPFNSISDEYIIQLYKYFYLGGDYEGPGSQSISSLSGSDDSISNGSSRNESFHNARSTADITRNDSWNFSTTRSPISSRAASNGEFKRLRGESDARNGGNNVQETTVDETVSPRMKSNHTRVNLYQTLEYPLPTQWIPQPGDAVIISHDGVSRLSPNPHWKSFMKIESSENMTAYGRQRMRESAAASQPQKTDFVSTWANKSVSLPDVGVYYFEVTIIAVENVDGTTNSNTLIGVKLLPYLLESEDEGQGQTGSSNQMTNAMLDNGVSSVHFMEMNRNRRGRVNSSADNDDVRPYVTEHTNENDPSISIKLEGLSAINEEKERMRGFFAYSGVDGKISTPRHIATYNESFKKDDVIGCGVNFIDGSIFYTKNGVFLGTAFRDIQGFDVIPAIALRPGNTVRTNFGLYEEFMFDIMGYQLQLKLKSYEHIFKSFGDDATAFQVRNGNGQVNEEGETNDMINSFEEDTEMDGNDEINSSGKQANASNSQDGHVVEQDALSFLIKDDSRLKDGHFKKPDTEKINMLSNDDGSLNSTLNILVNDYLIHEGMIDVAKGFLNDLRKDTCGASDDGYIHDGNVDYDMEVIRHNEQQIISEENILKLRYEVRKLINQADIAGCFAYIQRELPGLLEGNISLSYELKLVAFLHEIRNNNKDVSQLLAIAKQLSDEYITNSQVDNQLREKFRRELADISGLFAYDNPVEEAPEDLALYLSDNFLQDRVFQMVNSCILDFLGKESDCALDKIVKYTRSMVSTLMNYETPEHENHMYYKMVNLDEDLLNL